jgi:CelD/BcsL family acetyltransferase involved in cellulose biosynthesis
VITTHVLTGFDDPRCPPAAWDRLLARCETPTPFLTRPWLCAWWETLGQGDLLLVAAERAGELAAVAPLYANEGMVFFVGCGESDYLDFIGDVGDPDVLAALVRTARDRAPGFVGFQLHGLVDRSRTPGRLSATAPGLGLMCVEERSIPAVEVDLAEQADAIRQAVGRSMGKREEAFRQRGDFQVHRLCMAAAIRPHLPAFFEQHRARWRAKQIDSPYEQAGQRAFLERLLDAGEAGGWLRFLRLDLDGRPVAFEFAWHYGGVHYSAPWCFAIEEARHSPGHVLLRQSLLAAVDAGLTTYDLGIGDQDYKFRLPARVKTCTTWGLYPA